MGVASSDVNFNEELSAIEQWSKVISEAERTAALYVFHNILLKYRSASSSPSCNNGQGRPHDCSSEPGCLGFHADPDGSEVCQYESQIARTQVNHPRFSSARTFSTTRTAIFDSSSSSLSPDTANTVGNQAIAHSSALNSKPLAMPRVVFLRRSSPRAENIALGLASSARERSGTIPPRKEISVEPRSSRPYRTDFSGWLCLPLSPMAVPLPAVWTGSPVVGDNRTSMVNTPLLPMFCKTFLPTTTTTRVKQSTLAAAKLNDLYGRSNVPRLDGPDKLRRLQGPRTRQQ